MLLAAPDARAFRELVRLFARRLGETALGRVARFASITIAFVTIGFIVAVRASDGPSAPTAKIATSAVRWALWLVAVAIALAASHQRGIADRRDGIELLALSRGFDRSRLTLVRAAAAFTLTLRWMLLPAIVCTLASVASSGSLKVVLSRSLVLVAVVVFATIASLVLGPLGALADSIAPTRGRSLLLGALLASALVAEIAKDPALSITGALATVFNTLLYAVGAARLI